MCARVLEGAEETFQLGPRSAFTLRYAALSQRGYYPDDLYKANQDRYIIAPKLGGQNDQVRGADGRSCTRMRLHSSCILLPSILLFSVERALALALAFDYTLQTTSIRD